MRLRLYTLLAIFAASIAIVFTAVVAKDRFIPVSYSQLTPEARVQVDCLAENIYHEAGYEPEQGQVAVALVTLNRVQDPRYPKDICSVVKQKVKSTCQFSWYCEAKNKGLNRVVFERSKQIALAVYANYENMKDVTQGALFYHADYVNPRWKLQQTAVIGRHIFYKEREGT